MNRLLTIGLATAAVVVAIVGYRLIGNANLGGPAASQTPQPTVSSEPTPSVGPDGSLPQGPFTLWNAPGDVAITVTIPGPGFFGEPGSGTLVKKDADSLDGVQLFVFQGPLYVYGDACHWSTTTPAAPTNDIRTALEAQASSNGTGTGEFWRFGRGGEGRGFTLTVPASAVFGDCDEGQFRSWVSDPVLDTNARILQAPGEVDDLWVGTVNGVPMVFDVAYLPGTPHDLVMQLWLAVDQLATTYQMP